jgi:hypothetical protein
VPQNTNSVHFSRLLRKRGRRPEERTAAQNTEKFSPLHLIAPLGRQLGALRVS